MNDPVVDIDAYLSSQVAGYRLARRAAVKIPSDEIVTCPGFRERFISEDVTGSVLTRPRQAFASIGCMSPEEICRESISVMRAHLQDAPLLPAAASG